MLCNWLHKFENVLSQVMTHEIWNLTFKNIGNRLHAHGNRLLLCKIVIKLFGLLVIDYQGSNRLPESKNSGKDFSLKNYFGQIVIFNLFFEKFFYTCHTLISFGDCCLSTCDLRLTTSKCLIPVAMKSIKLQDISERKQPKTQKWGVNLSNTGVHSVNFIQNILEGGELINYRVHLGIFLKKPLGGNHLYFVKKWHPGQSGLP